MKMRLYALGLAAGLALFGTSAFADQTVTVSLWDHPGVAMSMNHGMGMNGDPATASMGITVDAATVPAGEVTFRVTNESMNMIHEMVVVPLSADGTLPYDATAMMVDEDGAGAIGEVSELDPGATGTVTLHLAAGTYVLICNVPGHYAGGMWTTITVMP